MLTCTDGLCSPISLVVGIYLTITESIAQWAQEGSAGRCSNDLFELMMAKEDRPAQPANL
jgi:hypothetical protein